MHLRQIGLPQTTQESTAGSVLCFGQSWTVASRPPGASAVMGTGAGAEQGAGCAGACRGRADLAMRKPEEAGGAGGGGGAWGGNGAAGGGGNTGARGMPTADAVADCWRMMALASSVASALQTGQLMATGIRSLTGSTSNSKRVPQGHWTLTFILRNRRAESVTEGNQRISKLAPSPLPSPPMGARVKRRQSSAK